MLKPLLFAVIPATLSSLLLCCRPAQRKMPCRWIVQTSILVLCYLGCLCYRAVFKLFLLWAKYGPKICQSARRRAHMLSTCCQTFLFFQVSRLLNWQSTQQKPWLLCMTKVDTVPYLFSIWFAVLFGSVSAKMWNYMHSGLLLFRKIPVSLLLCILCTNCHSSHSGQED